VSSPLAPLRARRKGNANCQSKIGGDASPPEWRALLYVGHLDAAYGRPSFTRMAVVRSKRSVTSGIWATKACRFVDEDKCPQTRYIEVTLGDRSGRGEPEKWTEKSVLKSVTGAITCVAARILPVQPFHRPRICLLVVRQPNGQNWRRIEAAWDKRGETYQLGAAGSSRCEESLRW